MSTNHYPSSIWLIFIIFFLTACAVSPQESSCPNHDTQTAAQAKNNRRNIQLAWETMCQLKHDTDEIRCVRRGENGEAVPYEPNEQMLQRLRKPK